MDIATNVPTDMTEEQVARFMEIAKEMDARLARSDHEKDNPTLTFPKKSGVEVLAGETRLGIPEGVSDEKAARILADKIAAGKASATVVRNIVGRVEDVLVAVKTLLQVNWGYTGKPHPDYGAASLRIPVGLDKDGNEIMNSVTVSPIMFEPLSATIRFQAWEHDTYGVCGTVIIETLKANEHNAEIFLDAVQKHVEQNSIYRGQIVEMRRRNSTDQWGNRYDFVFRNMTPDPNIVYNKDTMLLLEREVMGKIRNADLIREAGRNPKFNVLLYGPYGTGKTAYTVASARTAHDEGWTTIFFTPTLQDGIKDMEAALNLAQLYAPAMIVIEDVDRFYTDDSSAAVAQVSNLIDGSMNKSGAVSILMTTNHPEMIPKYASRSGRMSMTIEVSALNREAVEKMFMNVLGGELGDDMDFDALYPHLEGMSPAAIRNTFSRARDNAIISTGQVGTKLSHDDMLAAILASKSGEDFHKKYGAKSKEQEYFDARNLVTAYEKEKGITAWTLEESDMLHRINNAI